MIRRSLWPRLSLPLILKISSFSMSSNWEMWAHIFLIRNTIILCYVYFHFFDELVWFERTSLLVKRFGPFGTRVSAVYKDSERQREIIFKIINRYEDKRNYGIWYWERGISDSNASSFYSQRVGIFLSIFLFFKIGVRGWLSPIRTPCYSKGVTCLFGSHLNLSYFEICILKNRFPIIRV